LIADISGQPVVRIY